MTSISPWANSDPIPPDWEQHLRDMIAGYEIDTDLVVGWLVFECGIAAHPDERNPRLLARMTCRQAVALVYQIWEWADNKPGYSPANAC